MRVVLASLAVWQIRAIRAYERARARRSDTHVRYAPTTPSQADTVLGNPSNLG
jgi:hypothetical protein